MDDRTTAGLRSKALAALSLLWASCERVSFSESESLDRDRSRLEVLMVSAHQLACPACRRFRRQVHLLDAVLASIRSRREAGDSVSRLFLPPDARERIKAALRDATDRGGPVNSRAPTD